MSGAHLNPAVTAAAWVLGMTSLPLSLAYVVAQVAGATAGYGLLVVTNMNFLIFLFFEILSYFILCSSYVKSLLPDDSVIHFYLVKEVIRSLTKILLQIINYLS